MTEKNYSGPERHTSYETALESISGWAHRMGWRRIERVIDAVFSPFERDHCRRAHEADLARAMKLLQLED